jgi:hypothetical protein
VDLIMSIYHFPINARSKKPILNSFSQNGIVYDVYGGRFDVIKDKLMGKENLRPQSCVSIDEVISQFKKHFPEEAIAIRIYDALFGKHYVINMQGMRTEVESDDEEAPRPLAIKRLAAFDEFNIDDLVANSFFSPRTAILAARKAASDKARGQAQNKPSFKLNSAADETDADINRFGA